MKRKDKDKCIKWILQGGVDDGDCRCSKCKREYQESMNRAKKRRAKKSIHSNSIVIVISIAV